MASAQWAPCHSPMPVRTDTTSSQRHARRRSVGAAEVRVTPSGYDIAADGEVVGPAEPDDLLSRLGGDDVRCAALRSWRTMPSERTRGGAGMPKLVGAFRTSTGLGRRLTRDVIGDPMGPPPPGGNMGRSTGGARWLPVAVWTTLIGGCGYVLAHDRADRTPDLLGGCGGYALFGTNGPTCGRTRVV